ncbi:MAG: 4Fe-4S binding protein [Chloroflexi bacterium]|nr:4Fe-4S binding protein [Chloroflexota bacterium]
MVVMPVVDQEKCNGCELCINVCPCRALVLVKNVITVIETKDCGWCIQCEVVCPIGAITCPYEIVIEETH